MCSFYLRFFFIAVGLSTGEFCATICLKSNDTSAEVDGNGRSEICKVSDDDEDFWLNSGCFFSESTGNMGTGCGYWKCSSKE